MSNITHGMDVEQVDDLGNTLVNQAARLRSLASDTDGRVQRARWHGPDGTHFTTRAWPGHRSTMYQVADQIEELGRRAKENAANQRRTSEQLAGGSSGWPGGNVPWPPPGRWFLPFPTPLPGFGPLPWDSMWPVFEGLGDFFGDGITGGVDGSWQSGWSDGVSSSRQFGAAELSGEASYLIGARADASAEGGISSERIFGSVQAGAFIGAEAEAAGAIAIGGLAVGGAAYARAGAGANASARGSLSADGLELGAKGEAFAGVKAGGDVNAEFAGVEAGASGEVWAGVGAEFNADATVTLDEVALELDIGAALGVGGSIGFEVSFSPQETVEDIGDFFNPFN